MRTYCFFGLLGLFAFLPCLARPAVAAEPSGMVSLHVWPQGQKAAREELTSFSASAAEFEKMLKAEWRPENEAVFRGCFLARFTPAGGDRAPASSAKPARVCFPR